MTELMLNLSSLLDYCSTLLLLLGRFYVAININHATLVGHIHKQLMSEKTNTSIMYMYVACIK